MEQDKPRKTTPAKEAKKLPPRKAVERINAKSVGLNVYFDDKPHGGAHYVEIRRSYPAKKDEDGKATEWGYTPKLYAKHLDLLIEAATTAKSRIAELDANVEDEQYPEADQKAA